MHGCYDNLCYGSNFWAWLEKDCGVPEGLIPSAWKARKPGGDRLPFFLHVFVPRVFVVSLCFLCPPRFFVCVFVFLFFSPVLFVFSPVCFSSLFQVFSFCFPVFFSPFVFSSGNMRTRRGGGGTCCGWTISILLHVESMMFVGIYGGNRIIPLVSTIHSRSAAQTVGSLLVPLPEFLDFILIIQL